VQDTDSPWKELWEQRPREALGFFNPSAEAEVDWAQECESLEQELRKLAPEGATGKRVVDHLARLTLKTGDPRYLHVEVQGRKQRAFRRRMWLYNTRVSDHHGLPAASLAILIDRDPKWRPRSYREEAWGAGKWFRFPCVKVLDWADRLEELERHPNPVALFVLAHLLGQATRKKPDERVKEKVRLLRLLGERKLEVDEQARWFRWFDWLLPLPKERNLQVWVEARRQAQEGHMPFVTVAEQFGREEGRKEGRKEGHREGLLKGAELALETKFGAAGLQLMPALRALEDLAIQERVFDAIRTATSPDDLRHFLPQNGRGE
jgi:hypothetical protein